MNFAADKILVRFTQESIEAIFFTKYKKEDGTEGRLEINVPANEIDDRAASIFAETGIVEMVGKDIDWIKKGDIAITSYELFNEEKKLVFEDDNGKVFIVDPTTKYHKEENIAYGNRDNPKNQIAWSRGEIEEVTQLLAIIRDGELIGNDPYVFLNYLPEEEEFNAGGIMFSEVPEIIERQILSVSAKSSKKYEVKNGDNILVRLLDTFPVKFLGKEVICCNDEDLMMLINTP